MTQKMFSVLPYRLLGIPVALLAGLATLVSAGIVLVMIFLGFRSKIDFFIHYWARFVSFLTRMEVHGTGEENIPQGPCLFIFNHISLFDIPAILVFIRKKIRFGAKKELFLIPIFGQAMSLAGVLRIDRGRRHSAIETLKIARDRILQGETFILAAEGTRNKENCVGEFKSGPFVLAIDAQCPIVPVVLAGVYGVLPKKKLFFRLEKPHPVFIEILPPISTQGFKFETRHELKAKIRKQMVETFERLSHKLKG